MEEVDLALLRVELPIGEHHPYVLMSEEFRPFDQLYIYGYPDYFPDGGSVTLQCEGEAREQEKTLIKVQAGEIRPGHSGSPVLNYDTGKVCGIVSMSLVQNKRLGGLLIPVTTVFKYFPELRLHNQQTTNPNHPWLQLLPQQNSSNEQEVLDRYLKQQVRRYRVTRLPLLSNNAESIPLHIETLYIDLPLRQAKDVESMGWQLRESFTSALLVDRATHIWASQQNELCRISDQLKSGARLAVVGDPGCGKTTLQSFLAYSYACRQLSPNLQDTILRTQKTSPPLDALPNEPWIPVTLICRDLLEANFDESLINLIQYQLQKDNFSRSDSQLLADFFEKNMSEGKILLLIDGLDEIPTEEQRQKFTRIIINQANIYHAQMPIVLTSRIVGFSSVQTLLDSFNHLTVAPLSIDEKKQFVQAWARYTSSKVSDQDSQSIVNKLESLVCNSREVAKLCENIFLLVLIAQISLEDESFPKRRSDIYRRAVKLMIERRKGGSGLSLTVNEVCPHLEHLALQMRLEGKQHWAETKVLQAIEQLR
ncbi:MAG: NACHT domain-containing protein, partial [Leptolyngbyaceae cyanobacterium CRU_2_3]|nr:NACHT domain-containing protein [Leptolyngbyaceae cyanobacterium CRU_2_3]